VSSFEEAGMSVKFLDLKHQYSMLEIEIDSAIKKVFMDSDFIQGKAVFEFEKSFAKYCGAEYCISCGNGTDGLTILIKALDLPKGSTVIVPANTFIATAEAVINNGLNVVFADIDEDCTISPDSVKKLINSEVSAVIAVHLYGQPAKMNELADICRKNGIFLLEDAAQAHGAEIEGKKVGTLGDAAVFSFYPGKVLGAAGDAGAIVTNNPPLAKKCSLLCNHGRTEKYLHQIPGYNSRMDTIQAAVLNVKLKHLDEWIEKRNFVAEQYLEQMKEIKNIILPTVRKGIKHSWHLFVIRIKDRSRFAEHLKNNGIEFGIHYPKSLPEQPAFISQYDKCINYKAVSYSNEIISLPIGEHITQNCIDKVISSVKTFF